MLHGDLHKRILAKGDNLTEGFYKFSVYMEIRQTNDSTHSLDLYLGRKLWSGANHEKGGFWT